MGEDHRKDGEDPIARREWVKGIIFVAVVIAVLFVLFWLTNGPRAI